MNPLEQENRSLKRTLHVLISKAERNQGILQTFQAIELQLLSCQRLSELLDMLLVSLRQEFRLDAANLILFDPEATARELVEDMLTEQQRPQLRFSNEYQPLRELYGQHPRPRLLNPDAVTRDFTFPDNPRIKSCALLPLIRQNVIIGSLHLGSHDAQRYTDQVATDYIGHMAMIIAVCIENCINQETLHRLSIIDMLTKVNNRRSFDRELLKELSRASRNRTPLSCLFVDLDHFKRINDSYGHQTGDQVLRRVAQAIKKVLRKTDLIARYGGEEFALLLPACDHQRALHIGDKIRQQIKLMRFHTDNGEEFRATLSIGVSTCLPDSFDESRLMGQAHQLVASADSGVYRAKEHGRDTVVFVPLESIKSKEATLMDKELMGLE